LQPHQRHQQRRIALREVPGIYVADNFDENGALNK
jgi:hypothetical protein